MIDARRTGGPQSSVRHGAGFIVSGLLATATDAGMLLLLTRAAGLDPFTARLIAIACAMIVGFFAHRRLTFAVRTPATGREFGAYVGVAASAAALNYALYAAVLLIWPATEPLVAMLVPTLGGIVISYIGMRYAVFGGSR